MRRFFIKEPMRDELEIVGDDAHHIMRVLRAAIGQELIVADHERKVAKMRIVAFSDHAVRLKRIEDLDDDTEPPIEVTLAQCLPKSDKMDFIVQKAVELGVRRIFPVISENCVVKYDAAKQLARVKKWQRIADEASKQCGRTVVPEVRPIITLNALLREIDETTEVMMCYEKNAEWSVKEALERSEANQFMILIGPEGGFSPREAKLCGDFGVKTVSMGPRILRTETAALAAVSLVMYQKGDLNGRG